MKTSISRLYREIELGIKNERAIYDSLINGNYTQASEQLTDYLTNTCGLDISSISIDNNDMVEFKKMFLIEDTQ